MDPRWYASNYGLITDYFAEAFHYMLKNNSSYSNIISSKMKLGLKVEGRDDLAIQKTTMALLKLIHPDANPTDEEFEEILAYAIEGRRRVKEQMDKMKDDDEFSGVDLSYFNKKGEEIVVYCPESIDVPVDTPTQISTSTKEETTEDVNRSPIITPVESEVYHSDNAKITTEPIEKHLKIHYGDIGYSYENVFKDYLIGAKEVIIQDPYIRSLIF